MNIQVYASPERTCQAAAELFVELAVENTRQHKPFHVALAGGSTPRQMYQRLSVPPLCDRVDWSKVHVFFGDERCVPPDDPQSNVRMARESLLDQVPIPASQIYPIDGTLDAQVAAVAYERQLRAVLPETRPGLDLVLLGMGDDGHTASLFPHSDALRAVDRWVAAGFNPEQQMPRVTLTAAFINGAAHVAFLVVGAAKANVLYEVLRGDHDPHRLPSQFIRPDSGNLEWRVDQEAARRLT